MLKYIFSALSLFIYSLIFSQSTGDIMDKNYSHATEPGGILLVRNKKSISTSPKGLAHFEKKISIDSDTRFRMASISKQFTAMAVYLLIQDGKITFETPLRSIFPELSTQTQPIKVKHLLNHSSGLIDYENVIPNTQKSQLSDEDVLKLIDTLDTVYFEAGKQFRYSNTAFCLLSLVVERVAKQPYDDFCTARIFQKLGMRNAQISAPEGTINRAFGYHPRNPEFLFADQSITSATLGDGGVYISASDFSKWMDQNNPLFSDQFFKDLDKYKILVKDDVYYSLGFFYTISNNGEITLFHSGESTGFHNIMLFIPKQNYGVSLFTNRDDLIISNLFREIMDIEKVVIPNIKEPLFIWLNKVYNNE